MGGGGGTGYAQFFFSAFTFLSPQPHLGTLDTMWNHVVTIDVNKHEVASWKITIF